MSRDHLTSSTSQKSAPTSSSTSTAAVPELRNLDAKLQHLSDKVIQATPYILTVPTDRPYHLDPRLAFQWKRNTPFDHDEEQLQYLSFLAEWDNGLITPVGAWDNEKGGMDAQSQSGRSATGTPKVGARKVKMSLSDYKKKAAGQPLTPSTSKDSDERKKPPEAVAIVAKPKPQSTQPQGQKRPREETTVADNSTAQRPNKDAPVTKKSRPSPQASPKSKKNERSSPPLELPLPLSPTLPPVIEAELARLKKLKEQGSATGQKQKPKTEEGHEQVKGKKDTGREKSGSVSKPNGVHKPPAAPPKAAPSRPAQSTNPTLSLTGTSREKLQIKKSTEPKITNPKSAEARTVDSKSADAKTSKTIPSKIVKLKIPKAIRNRYNQLLKFQPRHKTEGGKAPKKEPAATHIEQRGGGSKAPARSSLAPSDATQSRAEKRPRQDAEGDAAPPQKRARAPSNLDLTSKPSTPIPSSFKSPVLSHHGSAQKQKGSTPAIHADEVSTPQGAVDKGTPTAPDSVDRPTKDGNHKSVASNGSKDRHPKSAELSQLHAIQLQHFNMGRQLKHAFSADLAAADKKSSAALKKRALAQGIESVLAFMFSYSCRDEVERITRPAKRDPSWITLSPLLAQLRANIPSECKDLRGLCLQLEAVALTAAMAHEYEKAASDEPGAAKTYLKHQRVAADLFADATCDLPLEDLQTRFPDTWRKKSRAPLVRSGKFEPRVDGRFCLPLSSITTGVEAVRAGKALLEEWCAKESVEWASSLGRKAEK